MLLELVLFLLLLITMINTFFWGLSVDYQHFKYTFNQGGSLPLVLFLLLVFSAGEAVSSCPKWSCLTQPADNLGCLLISSPNLVSSAKLHQPTPPVPYG